MKNNDTPASDANPLAPIINATGLPSGIKGKAQRVFLRFLAGSLAHPYVRQVRENLDDMEGRSRINMMVAEELGRQAIADPEFMERARARLLGETLQKQENLESVLIAAHNKIESHEDVDDDSVGDKEPSQDWINSFTREAELASSDELRDRLASVLAGEIRAPGSVSRSTIRVVAEMEKPVLDQFVLALEHRFGDAILKDNDDWTSGEMFSLGIALENEGLINGVTGSTHKIVKLDKAGFGILVNRPFVISVDGEPNGRIQLNCWLLTKVGQEIADLLGHSPNIAQMQMAADRINKSGLKSIAMGEIPPGGGQVRMSRILWQQT